MTKTSTKSTALLGELRETVEVGLNHVKDEIEGTYNLYDYWPERKQALALWHEKLARLERDALWQAA